MHKVINISFIIFSIATAILLTPHLQGAGGGDLEIFLKAANGDMTNFYYAPWTLHLFQVLSNLPFLYAHIAVGLINTAGLVYATRIFGGSIPVVLTSYAAAFSLFYGQPDGVWALGLGLMAWSVKQKRPALAAIGFFIALGKYYIGLPLGIGILWCFSDKDTALRTSAITGILLLGSLVMYGLWPLDILERWSGISPNNDYTIDLWRRFGPANLLLWVPILIFRPKSYTLWAATWMLTTSYVHIHGMTHLLVTTGPIGLIGHIGYALGFGHQLVLVQALPLYLYATWLLKIKSYSLGPTYD